VWWIIPVFATLLFQSQRSFAEPPAISRLLKCPADTESPKKGICCRKGSQNPTLQKAYGVDAHCIFHGPIVYGDPSQTRYTIINYEHGRLRGPRWEVVDGLIQSTQEYDDSAPVGVYHEFDRQGRLFLEGNKENDQITGRWRIHLRDEKKTYQVFLNSVSGASPIELCEFEKSDCEPVVLPTQEEVTNHREVVSTIIGFYKAHEILNSRYFETPETAFLPLRLGSGSTARLMGIVIENRLVTGWNTYHPFTYLDKDLGFVPIAKKENGTCLVQMLPSPLPWVWIPCPNPEINLEKTILSYQWSTPTFPLSLELSLAGEKPPALNEVRELIATGVVSIKPRRVFENNGKQWIEGTLTDFAKDLNWEIRSEELAVRKKLNAKNHVGKTVFFPLIFENSYNFLPLDHN